MIVEIKGLRSGQPVIKGTRIAVKDILSYLDAGMTKEEVLRDFPSLSMRDINDCVEYDSKSK